MKRQHEKFHKPQIFIGMCEYFSDKQQMVKLNSKKN